ncbi:AfsR/SARP family transcriptional regulator, partial [Kitasatospora sp. NPDC058263]
GYRHRLGPGDMDATAINEEVARARLLAAQGAPEEAVTGLRRALARWTGPAMAGLACPPVEAWARRLEESRLRAVEERIRLELGLGRHQDLVGELEQLVCAHPFREHLHGRLMLALHRSGRTAEALAVYRRLRTALIEELGIEPGPELRSLEREILLGVAAAPPPGEPAVRRRTRAGDAVHSSWCPV